MHNLGINARQVRTAHNELADRFEHVRALDWPLTARDAQALIGLVRGSLATAEQYIDDGEYAAAHQAVTVGNSACDTLRALHTLETMEV